MMKTTTKHVIHSIHKKIPSRWRATILCSGALALSLFAAIQANGQTIYVTDSLTNSFYSTTPNGTNTTRATGLNYPAGMTVNSASNFFISNNYGNTISEINSNTYAVTPYASGLNKPSDVAFDSSDNLFVRNEGDGTISKITPGGVKTPFATGLSYYSATNAPSGMIFDSLGNLYVGSGLSGGTQNIYKFNAIGTRSTFATGNLLNGMAGLAFDSSGNLWVANLGNNNIIKITSGGAQSLVTAVPANFAPQALSFDAAGDLFVGTYGPSSNNYKGNLYEMVAGTSSLVVVGTGLPYDVIAAVTVPEPSGALLLGVVGTLALLRRRRR